MAIKDVFAEVLGKVFGNKDEVVRKADIIDVTENIDEVLPKEMLEELSNGKGEDD